MGIGIQMIWEIEEIVKEQKIRREMNVVLEREMEEKEKRIMKIEVIEIKERERDEEMKKRMEKMRKKDEYLKYVVRKKEGEVMLKQKSEDMYIFKNLKKMGLKKKKKKRIYLDEELKGEVNIEVEEKMGERSGVEMKVMWRMEMKIGIVIKLRIIGVWEIVRV